MDKNCLTYWFPRIRDAGLPVPQTGVVETKVELIHLLDGKKPDGFDEFVAVLAVEMERVGVPAFLRTGHGSGKHNWKNCCHVRDASQLAEHVVQLVNWSECCGMFGELPYQVWCAREMLPTEPIAFLPEYGDMPLCREFRCFVSGAAVKCIHPYWPWDSVEDGFPRTRPPLGNINWGSRVEGLPQVPEGLREKYNAMVALDEFERQNVWSLASEAGEACGGDWSVDILWTRDGWYVTDMAEAARSFHWPECTAT